jgi:hypothetical protein
MKAAIENEQRKLLMVLFERDFHAEVAERNKES